MMIERDMNLEKLAHEILPRGNSLSPRQKLIAIQYAADKLLLKFYGQDTVQIPLNNVRTIVAESMRYAKSKS